MAFDKILVPYDGSAQSDKALDHAASLAKLVGAKELVLLHVVQEIPVPPMMILESRLRSSKTGEELSVSEVWKELYQEMKESALRMLESKKGSLAEVQVKVKVAIGYPPDRIIEVAEEEAADLIVMGSIGLTGLSKLRALGSVSRAVSERARCPVLIVH
jgi:nucleotide-binding universal stress UspA family protein